MTARVKERCRNLKISPAYFHLAVWKTLLFRFLNTDHVCLGINDIALSLDAIVHFQSFEQNLPCLRLSAACWTNHHHAVVQIQDGMELEHLLDELIIVKKVVLAKELCEVVSNVLLLQLDQ